MRVMLRMRVRLRIEARKAIKIESREKIRTEARLWIKTEKRTRKERYIVAELLEQRAPACIYPVSGFTCITIIMRI